LTSVFRGSFLKEKEGEEEKGGEAKTRLK